MGGRRIPAHAGKTARRATVSEHVKAHPRSRGENTIRPRGNGRLQGASPLTRGKHHHRRRRRPQRGRIPAHAGKTEDIGADLRLLRAHPRSRGENVLPVVGGRFGDGASPLTRGKHPRKIGYCRPPGRIPAHAGKTRARKVEPVGVWAHPRSRGENEVMPFHADVHRGASPLTRGKRTS